ncbi:hypothetical protein IGL62_000856 [Enterococcus sp. AZ137]
MFNGCNSLTSLDVSNFDTSLVQAMRYMFANCELLETIDVSNFNTESVNYLTYMFLNCSKVKKLDLSYFQFEDPVEMAEMLAGTTSLNELTLGKGYRFVDSANLPAIPVEDGNTGYWQNVGSGTVTNPAGEYVLTSEELMTNYTGAMADTYVWQKEPNYESILAKDSTLYLGETWDPQDNFISATDKEGNPLTFDQKMVSGKVDTTKVGVYPVTYQNGHQKKTVEIHVLAEPTKEKPDADTNQSGDKKPVPATPNETTNNNDQRDKKDEKNEKNEKNEKDEKDEQEEQEEQEDKKLPTTGYQKSSLSMIGMACFLLGLYFVYKKKINVK